jgi:F0F1-type ATP synthase alpha subunit
MKAEVIRELNSEQLLSGHMRIDLVRPLTRGNFILFKGERSTGKTQVAVDVIKQFLSEDESNRAVYVSLSTQGRDVSE